MHRQDPQRTRACRLAATALVASLAAAVPGAAQQNEAPADRAPAADAETAPVPADPGRWTAQAPDRFRARFECSNGTFVVDDASVGADINIIGTAEGFSTAQTRIDVIEGETTIVELCAASTIAEEVVDVEVGAFVENVDPETGETVTLDMIRPVIAARCANCHSSNPTHIAFPAAPSGVVLDTDAEILAEADRIHQQTVVTRAMPIGNLTAISEEERALIDAWYQGRERAQ